MSLRTVNKQALAPNSNNNIQIKAVPNTPKETENGIFVKKTCNLNHETDYRS